MMYVEKEISPRTNMLLSFLSQTPTHALKHLLPDHVPSQRNSGRWQRSTPTLTAT